MTTWRKWAPPWCLAILVVLAAGCGAASSTPTPKATATPPVAAHHPGKPMWLQSLRMTSSRAGWGLYYPANPADPSVNAPTLLARTTDGGRHWSLTAATPPLTSATGGGIPALCDKTGVAFATPAAGWLTSVCTVGLQGELLVSRDGGVTWAPQPLPLPAGICGDAGCTLTGPQFTGGTGFLTAGVAAGTPSLLTTRNLGLSWTVLPLPAHAGWYPRITFFGPAEGVLVSAGSQGSLGDVFYTTSNGGQTWWPVPQGVHFTQLGAAVDFVSPRAGFAWIQGGDATGGSAPGMYETTNSGRTWKAFAPKLSG